MILIYYQIILRLKFNQNLNLLTPDLALLKFIIPDEVNESIIKVRNSVIEAFNPIQMGDLRLSPQDSSTFIFNPFETLV